MDDKNVNLKDDYKGGQNTIDISAGAGKYSSVISEGDKQEDTYYTEEFLHDKNKAAELLKKYEKYDDHELLEKAVELDLQGKSGANHDGQNYGGEMKTHQLIYELLATYIIRNEHPRVLIKTKGIAEFNDAYEEDEEVRKIR